jgi:hypothetical protein
VRIYASCLVAVVGCGSHLAWGPPARAATREEGRLVHDATMHARRSLIPLAWTVDRGLVVAVGLMDQI